MISSVQDSVSKSFQSLKERMDELALERECKVSEKRLSLIKDEKERKLLKAKLDQAKEKEAKKELRKKEKANNQLARKESDEDPDLAGMVPGPQEPLF